MSRLIRAINWALFILTILLCLGLLYYGVTTGILDWDHTNPTNRE